MLELPLEAINNMESAIKHIETNQTIGKELDTSGL